MTKTEEEMNMTVREVIEALRHFNADDEVTVQDKVTEIVVDGKYIRTDSNQMAVLEIDALGNDDEGPVLVIGGLKLEAIRVSGGDLYMEGVGNFTHTGDSVELDAKAMEYERQTFCDSCGLVQPSSDIEECIGCGEGRMYDIENIV